MSVKIIHKEKAEGRTEIKYPDGTSKKEVEVVEEVIVDRPMANVGLKVGMTKQLREFESVRFDVSLFMPSDTDKDSLNETFKKCDKWVEKKMKKILKELEE